MRLINSSVEILPQEELYKQIELCGRTCYKSTDRITEDSAKSFVNRLIVNGHTAMLEHGAVYLKMSMKDFNEEVDDHDLNFYENPHTYFNGSSGEMCISTNLRVLYDYHYENLLKYLYNPTEEEFKDKFHKRITVKFTCDRAIANELVRHRVFSFAQESTRYCNYSKDKFGNELTYIIPIWMNLKEGPYKWADNFGGFKVNNKLVYNDWNDIDWSFLWTLYSCEYYYFKLLKEGQTPQEARQVLPLALKTELCMTGFIEDWNRFFEIRYFEKTGKVHPDLKKLTTELYNQFKEYGYTS